MHEVYLLNNKEKLFSWNTYALVFREKLIAIDFSTKKKQKTTTATATKIKTKIKIAKKVSFTGKHFCEIKCFLRTTLVRSVTNLKYFASRFLVKREVHRKEVNEI